MQADIGLVGLAVMGENLVLNMEGHGFTVAVYNRTVEKVDAFVESRGKDKNIIPAHSPQELVALLTRPRRIMMMVKAGSAVDETIQQILPYLEAGDILIDGGNSHYVDTERRLKELAARGIRYVGMGVSGGEEGALHGPSLMPGGDETAWPHIRGIFQSIAAQVEGSPCCDWIGPGGSGHFVKMVHNGIEYGDMQLIAEVYQILRDRLGLGADEMAPIFEQWNKGNLSSYLIEITSQILRYKDEDGEPLVDKILDAAGQKGTGKWTGMSALEWGVPLTLITEAVFARSLSARREARLEAASLLGGSPVQRFEGPLQPYLDEAALTLYAAKIVSYAQGFLLLQEASRSSGWNLNLGAIAMLWRGGCIIRSRFLGKIKEAYDRDPALSNLILDPYFAGQLRHAERAWRRIVADALMQGIPVPALASGLTWYDGLRTTRLPANLIQAQRDYFGAHTYERVDRPRGTFFHTQWNGEH